MLGAWSSTSKDEEKQYRKRQEKRFPQHACELPPHPDRVYPQLPPHADFWLRFKRWAQQQMVGWRACRPLKLLRPSTCSLETEQARQSHSRQWWMVHPHSRFEAVRGVVVAAAVALNACLFPLYFIFITPYEYFNVHEATNQHPFLDFSNPRTKEFQEYLKTLKINLEYVMAISDIIFIIHIVLEFITGYYDVTNNEMVLNVRMTTRRYLTTWFFVDFLSSMDFSLDRNLITLQGRRAEILEAKPIHASEGVLLILESLHLFRIHWLLHYVHLWCVHFGLHTSNRIAIKWVIFFFYFMQFSTFIHYAVPVVRWGNQLFDNTTKSWLTEPERRFFNVDVPSLLTRQYLLCLLRSVGTAARYMTFNTFMTLTTEDEAMLLFVMWVGYCFRVVLLTLVLNVAENKSANDVALTKVMYQVRTFMRHKELPMHIRHKILLQYRYVYTDRFFSERAILANLPASIREAVRLASGRQLVANSPLFRGVPKALVKNIVSEMTEELYLPSDVVYASGDYASHLFFINVGTVGVYLSTGEEVGHLEDGACFGQMGLILKEHQGRRIESVVALEVCEMLQLQREAFERLVQPLPRLYNRMRAAAMERTAEVEVHVDDDLATPYLMPPLPLPPQGDDEW